MYHILPDIFQLNILTLLHFLQILCITPNVSSQQTKMVSGSCVMNEVILANYHISCVHEMYA